MIPLIGILAILLTVSLHAVVTTMLISWLKHLVPRPIRSYGTSVRSLLVAISACALAVKHGVDITLWAVVFWVFTGPQFSEFEDAIYFSSVTYTTLGYGDVVLTGPWRLLCSFEAINGMILFGLSTALLFVLIEHLWLKTDDG